MTHTDPSQSPIDLKAFIRPVPDFPKPGILFRDITPLLADPRALAAAIEQLVAPWKHEELSAIAAVEARGFLFATPMALALGSGLFPFENRASCQPTPSHTNTNSNTAATA